MKIIDTIYEFIVTIQLVLTFIFLTQNYADLTSIPYKITVTTEIEFSFNLNFYLLISLIFVIYAIVIISALQLVSSGINESGTNHIANLGGFVVFYALLEIATVYYVSYFSLSVLINILITLVHLMKVMNNLMDK